MTEIGRVCRGRQNGQSAGVPSCQEEGTLVGGRESGLGKSLSLRWRMPPSQTVPTIKMMGTVVSTEQAWNVQRRTEMLKIGREPSRQL